MATVIQKQNPLAALLQPINQVLQYKIQQKLANQEQAKQIGQQIMSKLTTGELDPRFLATPEAESFLREMGLDKNPQIQDLINQGRAANAPIEAPSIAEAGPEASTEVRSPVAKAPFESEERSVGKALVSVPRNQATSKDVRLALQGEEAQRQLAIKQAEGQIENQNKILFEIQKDAIAKGRRIVPGEIIKMGEEIRRLQKNPTKVTYKLDDEGFVTANIEEIDKNTLLSNVRTQVLNRNDYLKPVTDLHDFRAKAVKDLGAILRGELESVQALAATSGMDPKLAAVMNQVLSTDSKKKLSKMKPVNAADLYMSAVNQAIEAQNKANRDRGLIVGIDKVRIDEDAATPLTFEEIAGRPREEWDDAPDDTAPPAKSAAELAAEKARNKASAGPGSPVRPEAASKAKTQAEKIKSAYEEISSLVSDSKKSNALLSSDEVLKNIRDTKELIKSDYGLNEREYILLEQMVMDAIKKK